MKKPLLLLTSDWHLRVTVPVSRAESDWFQVMESRLSYLKSFNLPIVVAGDIFDRWNPPAALVSWCMDHMPQVYGIPGQHDLPYHSYKDRMNGAYGAMVKAGKIIDLEPGKPHLVDGVYLHGFPWGEYNLDYYTNYPEYYNLAVVHKYVWSTPDTGYTGVDQDSNVAGMAQFAKIFDAVLIGDNHIPWKMGKFFNHGSLFSTSKAQIDHKLRVGILMDDGTVEMQECTENPEWQSSVLENPETNPEVQEVTTMLSSLELDSVSFEEVLRKAQATCKPGTSDVIREVIQSVFIN